MRLPRWYVVGFTGHRRLGNEPVVRDAILAALGRLADQNVRLAVTGSAAAGADTLFLEAARQLQVPALVMLPFDRAAFRKGFTTEEWQRAEPLIDSAAEIDTVSSGVDQEAGYLETGIRTVDRSDVLVAVWDGEPARGPAGTGAIVEYARALGKPLIVIDPRTGAATFERLQSGDAGDRADTADAAPAGDGQAAIAAYFADADARALQLSPAAHWLVFWIIVLHLLSTVTAIAALSFHLPDRTSAAASVVKLSLLVLAIWLAWRHRRAHHEAMRHRIKAELCRSVLALWPLAREAAMLPRVPVPGFEREQRDLALTWLVDGAGALPLQDAQRAYLTRIREQHDYFSRQHARASRRYRWLQVVAFSSTVAAIACVLLSVVLPALGREGELYATAKFLSIVLPLANAAALSAVLALDLGRRVERYQKMASDVGAVMMRVRHATTWPTLWRAARDGEELLLYEAAEWLAVARVAGGTH